MSQQDEKTVVFLLNGYTQKVTGQLTLNEENCKTYVRIGFEGLEYKSTQFIDIGVADLLTIMIKSIQDGALNSEIVKQINEIISNIENMEKILPIELPTNMKAIKEITVE